MSQKQSKANELFFVVDDQDNPLEPWPRRLVHGHGVWHRVSHIWVVNSKGQILCQQRALSKELNPGYWESFFGGHLRPGETYAEAAERELREELDISASPEDLRLWRVYRFNDPKGSNNEFQGVFTIHWDGDLSSLRFTDGEVEQVKWQDAKSIGNFIKSQSTPWTFCGYELDLIEYIENRKI